MMSKPHLLGIPFRSYDRRVRMDISPFYTRTPTFLIKSCGKFTRCILLSSQPWNQIDRISSGPRRHGSIDGCLSLWFTPTDSDNTLSRTLFCLRLVCGRANKKTTHPTQLLLDDNYRLQLHSELSAPLSS